ncbi:MAG: hypothetical protein IPJ10_17360 [Flavobacteriales bacterium]|nr:hypothetical protein [Flavobacteriales bacterium]
MLGDTEIWTYINRSEHGPSDDHARHFLCWTGTANRHPNGNADPKPW